MVCVVYSMIIFNGRKKQRNAAFTNAEGLEWQIYCPTEIAIKLNKVIKKYAKGFIKISYITINKLPSGHLHQSILLAARVIDKHFTGSILTKEKNTSKYAGENQQTTGWFGDSTIKSYFTESGVVTISIIRFDI